MSGTIKFRIDKKNEVHIEVDGVEGPSCEELTADFISRIGEVEEHHTTEEYVQEIPDYINQFEE